MGPPGSPHPTTSSKLNAGNEHQLHASLQLPCSTWPCDEESLTAFQLRGYVLTTTHKYVAILSYLLWRKKKKSLLFFSSCLALSVEHLSAVFALPAKQLGTMTSKMVCSTVMIQNSTATCKADKADVCVGPSLITILSFQAAEGKCYKQHKMKSKWSFRIVSSESKKLFLKKCA